MVKICIEGTRPEVEAFLEGLQTKYLYVVCEQAERGEEIRVFCEAKRVQYRWIHIETKDGRTLEIPCWDLEVSTDNEKSQWKFQSYDIFT